MSLEEITRKLGKITSYCMDHIPINCRSRYIVDHKVYTLDECKRPIAIIPEIPDTESEYDIYLHSNLNEADICGILSLALRNAEKIEQEELKTFYWFGKHFPFRYNVDRAIYWGGHIKINLPGLDPDMVYFSRQQDSFVFIEKDENAGQLLSDIKNSIIIDSVHFVKIKATDFYEYVKIPGFYQPGETDD